MPYPGCPVNITIFLFILNQYLRLIRLDIENFLLWQYISHKDLKLNISSKLITLWITTIDFWLHYYQYLYCYKQCLWHCNGKFLVLPTCRAYNYVAINVIYSYSNSVSSQIHKALIFFFTEKLVTNVIFLKKILLNWQGY